MKQILLIDDDPTQLRVREIILRGSGFGVSVATSAESAMAALRTIGPRVGLIITDHILPGAPGSEFVRELRQIMPDVFVIVLSGMAEAEEEYSGLNVIFRQKPIPPAELIELAKHALREAA